MHYSRIKIIRGTFHSSITHTQTFAQAPCKSGSSIGNAITVQPLFFSSLKDEAQHIAFLHPCQRPAHQGIQPQRGVGGGGGGFADGSGGNLQAESFPDRRSELNTETST
jgi:hypothetical protein